MSFSFHDINHIFEGYLDDLATHSCKWWDHYTHLWIVFERCRYYKIWLNPNKCTFFIESWWLLGFIVSNKGIMVEPLKAEAIVNLPLPMNICQLQSLRGKNNFLRRFIVNYENIKKVFCDYWKKGSHLYGMKLLKLLLILFRNPLQQSLYSVLQITWNILCCI